MKLFAFPAVFESPRGLLTLGFFFWIWMIFECVRRERLSGEGILWLLLVVCVPDLGSLIYFLLRVVKIRG